MSPKKIFLVFVMVLMPSSAFLIFNTRADHASKADVKSAKKVHIKKIAPTQFAPTSPYCGFANSTQHAEIAPEINGTVQKLLKNEGEFVQTGEIL